MPLAESKNLMKPGGRKTNRDTRSCNLKSLMMEKADSCKCHNHSVFIASLYDIVISYGAAGLCHIFHSAPLCSFNIISEGKESIRSKADISIIFDPVFPVLTGKFIRLSRKESLPCAISQHIHAVITGIEIDGIIPVCSMYIISEGKIKDAWSLTKEPLVGFISCQSRTVNPAPIPMHCPFFT